MYLVIEILGTFLNCVMLKVNALFASLSPHSECQRWVVYILNFFSVVSLGPESWWYLSLSFVPQDSLTPRLPPWPPQTKLPVISYGPVKSTETCLAFCYYVNNIVSKGHEFQAPSNYFVRILFWSLWEGENEIYTQRVALERSPQSSEEFMTY